MEASLQTLAEVMHLQARNVGVKTCFQVRRICVSTGEVRQETGWSFNTLLTNGRNQLATQSNWANAVQLGTSSTAPDPGQTGLLGYVNGTTAKEETVWGAQSSAPWYGWKRIRFRFTPGQVTGNLNEVGLGWSTASGATIAFRALLVDITGVQTTVTPLPDEYVDVVVEIRYYPPLDDVTGSVTLNSVTYNYIIRAAEVTNSTWWGSQIGEAIGHLDLFSSYWQAYDGDIAAINLGPSGVAYQADDTLAYDVGYSNNSYQRQMAQVGGPNAWNATTGKKLRSFRFVTTAGAFQIQFDSLASPGNGIPKTTGFNLKLQFIIGWAEAGPIFTGSIPTQNWTNGVAITPLDISTYYQPNLPEPIVYSVVAGVLPTGLSLNASTGVISGTPSVVSSNTLQIECENDVGAGITNVFSWTVA